MRIAQFTPALVLALVATLLAQSTEKKTTVTGKLTRVMAIGAESTGWSVEFDSATIIEGKPLHSIQIRYGKTARLEKLANKQVRAIGILSHRYGVETGDQPVLDVSSIKEVKTPVHPAAALVLSGSEWLLEDLAGAGVLDNVPATLAFPESGKTAGNGSCNRFFGSVEIHGDVIHFGALASSRMACPEAVMNQETKYLQALQAAERFECTIPTCSSIRRKWRSHSASPGN
jgi:heat shock protein HslJ